MPTLQVRHARFSFAFAGVIIALGAPLGWMLLSEAGLVDAGEHIYYYLTVSTMIVFGVFGYGLGHLYDRVQLLSERDDLTGLFNQNAFLRTASFLLQLAMRHKEPIAFLMMDIDHFKEVNDNHNHLVGSHVLKEIARIIGDSTRKSDLTARFGGDEYVLCLPRTTYEDARMVAERIRAGVEGTEFVLRDHKVRVTVSVGVASAEGVPGLDMPRFIEAADQALYDAKDKGRNCVVGKIFEGATKTA